MDNGSRSTSDEGPPIGAEDTPDKWQPLICSTSSPEGEANMLAGSTQSLAMNEELVLDLFDGWWEISGESSEGYEKPDAWGAVEGPGDSKSITSVILQADSWVDVVENIFIELVIFSMVCWVTYLFTTDAKSGDIWTKEKNILEST